MSSTQTPTRPSEDSSRRDAGFRGFLRSSAIFTVGPVVGRVLGLLVVPFVVDTLGPEDFGRFELLSTAASALASVLLIGLDLSAISVFHRPAGRDSKRVFPSALAVAAILGAIAVVTIAFGRNGLSATFLGDTTYGMAVLMVGLYGLVSVVGLVGRAALRAAERASQHSVVSATSSIVTTLLVIGVIVAGGSLGEIMAAHVAGAAIGALLALWLARDLFAAPPQSEIGRALLVLGVPQLLAIAALWGGEVGHRTILNELVGPEAVGALGIGARIALALGFVVIALQSAWHPRVFDLLERDDGLAIVTKDAVRIGAVLSVAAVLLAWLAAPGVAYLGRGEFTTDATAIAGWMIVMVTGTGFLHLATLHSVTERKFGDTTIALLVGLGVSVVIAAWLVPGSGMLSGGVGSAVALASSQWIAAAVGWVLAGRGKSLQLSLRTVTPALIAMPACVIVTSGAGLVSKLAIAVAALGLAAMQLWGTRPTAG